MIKIEGCGELGRVSKFNLIAQPIIAGVTGKFVSCANEEGVIWYIDSSLEDCLRLRVPWKKLDRLIR